MHQENIGNGKKMNKTKIEYCDYTWTPYTGCKNDCWYCYVKRLAKRFGYDRTPTFHEDRLHQPLKAKPGSKIFACSTADLFGDWVESTYIYQIIDIAEQRPNLTFQFLTKNPKRYYWFRFPENCWLGTTITHGKAEIFGLGTEKRIRFVSLEPLLGPIKFSGAPFDWIIIGALTGPQAKKYSPKIGWICDILSYADDKKIPVFIKNNLGYHTKRQEFPIDLSIVTNFKKLK